MAERGARETMRMAIIFMSFVTLVVVVFAVPILKMYTSDQRVIDIGVFIMRLYAFALPAIRATARELREKMAALDAASLPARMESKKEEFQARRSELGRAVSELALLAETGEAGADEKAIRDAIEAVHRRYVLLEEVF